MTRREDEEKALRDDEIVFEGDDGPAFLNPQRAEEIGYVEAPVGYTENDDSKPDFSHWDEYREPDPDPAGYVLKPRHKEVARLHALGKTNNEICRILGYSTSRMSILLGLPAIQREVDRYRQKLYEKDHVDALKDLGTAGLEVMEEMIRDPKNKLRDRVEASKWVLEKITGKPKQEVSIESQSLNRFMDVMKQMRESGETLEIGGSGARDVTPGETIETTAENPDGPEVQSGSQFDKLVDDLLD